MDHTNSSCGRQRIVTGPLGGILAHLKAIMEQNKRQRFCPGIKRTSVPPRIQIGRSAIQSLRLLRILVKESVPESVPHIVTFTSAPSLDWPHKLALPSPHAPQSIPMSSWSPRASDAYPP